MVAVVFVGVRVIKIVSVVFMRDLLGTRAKSSSRNQLVNECQNQFCLLFVQNKEFHFLWLVPPNCSVGLVVTVCVRRALFTKRIAHECNCRHFQRMRRPL